MRLNALALALRDPADELDGLWTREQLEAQNAAFAAAVNRAFELGLENRASAAREVKLPPSLGPRFVAPPLPDGLWRSAASDATCFVARG
jgi:hypothetical protein